MTTDLSGLIPTQSRVEKAGDADRVPFSPTNTMRFVFDGGPGLPDFFEEHGRRGDGPPLHRHPWPSWELVVEGEIRVSIDGVEQRVRSGDAVYVAPGAPHTYVIESETARVVGINLSDGHFPAMQREAASLLMREGGPDMQDVVALAGSHGVEVLGPPLALERETARSGA